MHRKPGVSAPIGPSAGVVKGFDTYPNEAHRLDNLGPDGAPLNKDPAGLTSPRRHLPNPEDRARRRE